jgi:hypothetical protein
MRAVWNQPVAGFLFRRGEPILTRQRGRTALIIRKTPATKTREVLFDTTLRVPGFPPPLHQTQNPKSFAGTLPMRY